MSLNTSEEQGSIGRFAGGKKRIKRLLLSKEFENISIGRAEMKVTAWNNGQYLPSGAGYGLKLGIKDRDRWFDRKRGLIWLRLEGEADAFEVNVAKPSFWSDTCHELIHKRVGQWLIANQLAPWPKGQPPRLELEHIKDNHFYLRKQ